MNRIFRLTLPFFLVGVSARATQGNQVFSVFQSGIAVSAGLGFSSASLRAKDAAGLGVIPQNGYRSKIKIANGPTFEHLIGSPDEWVDFTGSGSVKNGCGVSWNIGVLAQKNLDLYTMGARWILGFNGASSKMGYKTGNMYRETVLDNESYFISDFALVEDQKITNFILRNQWFSALIFEFGYLVANRVQLFLGPGISFQGQKLCCINDSGKSSGGVSKMVWGPIMSVGTRYAFTQRISLGVEYQRQWLNKKTWNKISDIVPNKTRPYGTPILKTNNNLFLMTLSYMFSAK
ncbi:outer membrane protein [Holospora undulata]|uniref:Outer membrane protein beta-barrel domain-containing protein n=1 Tax=Holospora undulata HU1 TaxID=1321371 RepID=A0A061JHJ2_9PROT|nr:hypothetical protein [Holospora undulata]ETZ04897.1 hypothetical protein K737_300692 [Holospora undulata HU1]